MAGYLGAIPVPQATQHRESFTATSGQTTFNTAGYTVGFLDVYLNGSHLSPADFTATNGSDVVLASGASADDVCDIISYTAFEVADQTFTGTTTMDVAAITGSLNVDGTVTADGLTVDGTDLAVSFNGSSKTFVYLTEGDTTDLNTRIYQSGGNFGIQTITDDLSASKNRVKVDHSNGDISFYEDTGTTAKFFWDASAESLGIGTSAPEGQLHLYSSSVGAPAADADDFVIEKTGDTGLSILSTTTGRIYFGDAASNDQGSIRYVHSDNSMRFETDSSEAMRIDSTGAVTMPAQPAFQAVPASNQSNLPINAITTVVFGTERFDQNADFASNTFTAPVTGKYQLNASIYFQEVDIDTEYLELRIFTSNRTYIAIFGTSSFDADNYLSLTQSQLVDMDAGDTALIQIGVPNSGTAQADITPNSSFGGYLVA